MTETISTTAEALAATGVTTEDFTPEQQRQFDELGYFIVPGFYSPLVVDELRTEFDRWEKKAPVRTDLSIEPDYAVFLLDLLNKASAFDHCLRSRPTLAAAHHLLGEIRVHSLNGRNPARGRGQQALHSDVPRLHPTDWRLVNTMIMLDDMSEENGATRLVPGSHKWPPLNVPHGNLSGVSYDEFVREEDKEFLPKDAKARHPAEVKIVGAAGSICVINGHIWHGGTENRSGAKRRLLHMAIERRDLPTKNLHKQNLTPSLLRRSTPATRYLLDIEGAQPSREDYAYELA